MAKLSDEGSPTLAARRIHRVLSLPGLHAFEASYHPWSRLPEHGHAAPFFTYVLRGSYIERAGHYVRHCGRGAVIFHDQEIHTNEVGGAGTASFNLELDPEIWREFTEGVGFCKSLVGRVLGGDIEWMALRAWREFLEADISRTLAVEEAIVLLCDAARRDACRDLFDRNQRLDRCISFLDAHSMQVHRLAGVARIAGVHPMHLAKLFRRRFGYSMGEYLRRRRIAWSCGELSRGEDTITAIAHKAGFADHPHFTRTFRRVTGCTPEWYRARMTGAEGAIPPGS
jgi:AraC family transcriptional regulator